MEFAWFSLVSICLASSNAAQVFDFPQSLILNLNNRTSKENGTYQRHRYK